MWPTSLPELATERLRLRAPHNLPTLATLAEAREALERLERRRAARETIRWAIELRQSGEMIGTVGLLRFDLEHRHAELGYEIARRWWGRGLTPEAAAAVIGYGFSALGLHRIEAGVLPGNDASVAVLRKLGFREEGTRRDYLYAKGGFHSLRWFSLLETDPRPDAGLRPRPTTR